LFCVSRKNLSASFFKGIFREGIRIKWIFFVDYFLLKQENVNFRRILLTMTTQMLYREFSRLWIFSIPCKKFLEKRSVHFGSSFWLIVYPLEKFLMKNQLFTPRILNVKFWILNFELKFFKRFWVAWEISKNVVNSKVICLQAFVRKS
jgi:hypothetical protein